MTEGIIERIKMDRYGISRSGLIDGSYQNYLLDGLKAVTLCEYGSLRSPIAAEIATTNRAYPSLFLIGGVKGLVENLNSRNFEQMIRSLNSAPLIAVILYRGEEKTYSKILSQLNYKVFRNEGEFVETIN